MKTLFLSTSISILLSCTLQGSDSWQLLGAKKDINIYNSSKSRTIWTYSKDGWHINSSNLAMQNLIESNSIPTIKHISKGEGYWEHSKEYISENIVISKSFDTEISNWSIAYSGACEIEYNSTLGYKDIGSLQVTNRAHSYDGPNLNITTSLEANRLYILRVNLKDNSSTSDTYNLMVKIGQSNPKYLELSRVKKEDDQWHLLRAFVSFTQEQIDLGIKFYVNSKSYTNDFYLDDFTLSYSNYTPPSNSEEKIIHIDDNLALKGINLIAYNDEDSEVLEFMNYSYYNYDLEDFYKIRELGFNSIRLALWHKYFKSSLGYEWLDTIISWAKETGLYIMLDMHAPDGGGFQGPDNITDFWREQTYKDEFIEFWESISKRYKNESAIVAYDLINEPCPPTQQEYLELMNSTIEAIRKQNDSHIINVETSFSSDNEPFILSDSNILYDFHFYDPWSSFTAKDNTVYKQDITNSQIESYFEDYASFYAANTLPFNVSEFGQRYSVFEQKNSLEWVSDTINLINKYNGSYFYFSFKGNEFGLYEGQNSFARNSKKNELLYEYFKGLE